MAKQPTSSGRKPYVRRNRTEPLANSIGKLTKPVFGRRGMADGAIAQNWREIVGPAIAQHSQPEKISYPGRERTGGLLHLRVDTSAMATQLQHLEPQLIERINAHFGFAAVERMRFIHGPLPERSGKSRQKPDIQPTAKRREELDHLLSSVEDPELREALEKLGSAVSQN